MARPKAPAADPAPGYARPELAKLAARDVQLALAEDLGPGDLLAELAATAPARARIETNDACVLAGVAWAEAALAATCGAAARELSWLGSEGEQFAAGATVCVITAPQRALLAAERTMLNFLQLLSATATGARAVAVAAGAVPVYDTRKTLPGLRAAQRHATAVGGMRNNRAGLFAGAIVKDNHVAAAGSVAAAVAAAFERLQPAQVQVEVADAAQLDEAIAAGATRLMLDNWRPERIEAALAKLGAARERLEIEATGGIGAANAARYAACGVDRLSSGEPTRAPPPIDMSMVFEG